MFSATFDSKRLKRKGTDLTDILPVPKALRHDPPYLQYALSQAPQSAGNGRDDGAALRALCPPIDVDQLERMKSANCEHERELLRVEMLYGHLLRQGQEKAKQASIQQRPPPYPPPQAQMPQPSPYRLTPVQQAPAQRTAVQQTAPPQQLLQQLDDVQRRLNGFMQDNDELYGRLHSMETENGFLRAQLAELQEQRQEETTVRHELDPELRDGGPNGNGHESAYGTPPSGSYNIRKAPPTQTDQMSDIVGSTMVGSRVYVLLRHSDGGVKNDASHEMTGAYARLEDANRAAWTLLRNDGNLNIEEDSFEEARDSRTDDYLGISESFTERGERRVRVNDGRWGAHCADVHTLQIR